MFMESLQREDGYDVLGGLDDERVNAARYRLLHDHFYIPLGEFVDFGMAKLQKDPRIATLYSQAAGLTHFLIYYDDARYRDALVSYSSVVYAARDNHDTLARLTGASYGDLDKQYREFLEGKRGPKTAADGAAPANPSSESARRSNAASAVAGFSNCHRTEAPNAPVVGQFESAHVSVSRARGVSVIERSRHRRRLGE